MLEKWRVSFLANRHKKRKQPPEEQKKLESIAPLQALSLSKCQRRTKRHGGHWPKKLDPLTWL